VGLEGEGVSPFSHLSAVTPGIGDMVVLIYFEVKCNTLSWPHWAIQQCQYKYHGWGLLVQWLDDPPVLQYNGVDRRMTFWHDWWLLWGEGWIGNWSVNNNYLSRQPELHEENTIKKTRYRYYSCIRLRMKWWRTSNITFKWFSPRAVLVNILKICMSQNFIRPCFLALHNHRVGIQG